MIVRINNAEITVKGDVTVDIPNGAVASQNASMASQLNMVHAFSPALEQLGRTLGETIGNKIKDKTQSATKKAAAKRKR